MPAVLVVGFLFYFILIVFFLFLGSMMGFGEEAGVIPRFCRELFSRLASIECEEVKCHIMFCW